MGAALARSVRREPKLTERRANRDEVILTGLLQTRAFGEAQEFLGLFFASDKPYFVEAQHSVRRFETAYNDLLARRAHDRTD